jgi:integrase
MKNKDIKEAYLKTKENAWSYASHKSEASRLAAIPEELLADPQALYEHFTRAGYKPYTIKTLFVRASQLHEFAYPNKPNKVKRYMQEHARLFKAVYSPKRPAMSFATAVERVKAELSPELRAQALALLASGLRISEANAVKDGVVFGKGNKARAVHNAPQVKIEQHKLRRALKPLGLTPHMLRKLAATRAVELGARESELLTLFGWSSMQTASYYLTASGVDNISKKLLESTKL